MAGSFYKIREILRELFDMMSVPPVVYIRVAYIRKELERMTAEQGNSVQNQQALKIIFASELFSKLAEQDQDAIIAQIEALLSREE